MRSNRIEVGDIFRQFGSAYREIRKLPLQQLKAMSAIEKCRTAALGGHIDICENSILNHASNTKNIADKYFIL